MSREKAIMEGIRAALKQLRMPGLSKELESLYREARSQKWSLEELTLEMCNTELRSREISTINLRIKQARFPELKPLDSFDFEASEAVDRDHLIQLAGCQWIDKRNTVIFAGPIGTGKTHLATALGLEACRKRYRCLFFRAADLVRDLLEAKDERILGRMHKKLLKQDILIIDELGFIPFDRAGGELLFNILSDRYERKATLITTNLAFSEWTRVFGNDEKLTGALLDRLVHHCEIITTSGQSYRRRKMKDETDA